MKHIYYKNDFAVEITLLNASGEVIAPPNWQWHIEFSDGRRKYICSVEKGNAKVVGNTIMCYLDNHKFCCGEIGYKFVQAIPDLNYLDGFQNLITPKALPIELWEQESDNDVNIQSSVVPAYVVYDAYTKAESDALLSGKVSKSDIVQSTGTSETAVMSQKASTMAFAANTPSGDPLHNMYVEVGAIYNDTGKDIERVDQWGDTIIHKDGCWYLNGLGDLTNHDLLQSWIWGNSIREEYFFKQTFPTAIPFLRTNIPFIHKQLTKANCYDNLAILNHIFDTFSFNDISPTDINNRPINFNGYNLYTTYIKKYYGWIVAGSIDKLCFSPNDKTECVGLVLTENSYINLPKLRADCIRQIIDAVRATENITITIHPEAYERAIADTGVQTALANKTNVSLAKGE